MPQGVDEFGWHDVGMPTLRLRPTTALIIAVAVMVTMLGACGSEDAAEVDPAPEMATSLATAATVEAEQVESSGADVSDGSDDIAIERFDVPVDLDRFFEGALVEEPTTAPCTLSDGSASSCYALTVAGFPVDGEVGPFCPRTTSDTADEVGIWFDGNQLYDLDGDFILDLAGIYDDEAWQMHDGDGNVNVTDSAEEFEAAARPDVDPDLMNHCVEGRIEWLDGGEAIPSTVEIPAVPAISPATTPVNGSVGVTLNGVLIDGQAPVQLILDAYTIAAFDDCGGHVNPAIGYHLHGAAGCSEAAESEVGDTPAFGYALDGYAIHSPLYGEQLEAAGLDECNGHNSEINGYHYHAKATESNAVLSCFVGETANTQNQGRGAEGRPRDDGPSTDAAGAAGATFDPTLGTPESAADFLRSYSLIDETRGTMVSVNVDGDTRTIVSNSLPDHETGEFPNPGNPNTISEQSLVLEYPTNPTRVDGGTLAQRPGIAVNGIAFEPGTAETVACESGEIYRIEGLQDLYDLGMDFNNAHVQPTGQYHYHGIAELLVDDLDQGEDPVLVGFAADGFLMYYSPSGVYRPGYELVSTPRAGTGCTASGPAGGADVDLEGTTPDGTYDLDWVFDAGRGDLDGCNGTEIDGQYVYLITDDYPFIPRCLNGEFADPGGAGGRQTDGQGGPGPGPGGAPDLTDAAETLGVSVQELQDALGGPPPDLDAAAEALGISVEELEAVLPAPPG